MNSGRIRRGMAMPFAMLLTLAVSFISANPGHADTSPALRAYDRTADGGWAVVGASAHDGWRGAAYVYRRGGAGWTLDATLTPPGRGAAARFGGAVAIAGDLLVVGAPWDEGWKGAAYVYERTSGAWRLAGRLTPVAAVGDRFGARVSIADGTVSVTAADGAVARFTRGVAGWDETSRAPAGAPAASAPAPGMDPVLVAMVAHQDALAAVAAPVSANTIAPPSFVRATDASYEDRTEIRWAAVGGGPFLYKIYRRVSGQPVGSNVLIRVASQDDSLFADATGTPGVTYTYCVTVLDMNNAEGAAACDDGSRIVFAPTGFAATDGVFEGFARLTWTDRSNVEAGYRITRDGAPLRETIADATVFDDSTAVPGITYTYAIVAFDAGGNISAQHTDTGQSAFIAAPLQVAASDGLYPDKVALTWRDNTALEVNYLVYRGGTLRATLPAGTQSFDDVTATPGTAYEYCVAAVDASNRESVRGCDFGGIGILPAAANVVASDGTFDDKVHVAWQDTSSIQDGFLVYRMPVGTTDSTLVANVGPAETSFDDTGGQPGQGFTYCVVAFSNQGGRSVPACDDGLRAVVIAPASVTATDGTFEDRVDLTWESNSSSAVLYKIYRGGVFIRSVAGDRRSYSDFDAASGAPITYEVAAVTAVGVESPKTSDLGSRIIHAPVSAKATDQEDEDHVAVTWTDLSQIETGFFVYRRPTGSHGPLERIAIRPSNSAGYDDETGVPGAEYDYLVTAFHAYGADRADTTESQAAVDSGGRVLLPPTFVDASDAKYEDRIVVTWVDNSRFEEAYHVWRRNLATNDSTRIAVLPPNANRFEDLTIAFGANYEYSVYAVDSLGGALLGRSAAGKDAGGTAILPPASVKASDDYADRVVVAWIDQSARETGYRVSRGGVAIGTVASNVTTFTDLNAADGVLYDYCVRAISASDSSDDVCDSGQVPDKGGNSDSSSISFSAQVPTPGDNRGANFGASLGGDDERIIVGAPNYHYGSGSPGVAYIMRRSGAGFVLEQTLVPPTSASGMLYGNSVALSGTTAIVASTGGGFSSCSCSGTVYFYSRNTTTNVWSLVSNVSVPVATNPNNLTTTVDVDGDWAVLGQHNAGRAFVYHRVAGAWSQSQILTEAGALNFGISVGISRNTIVIGAPSYETEFFTIPGILPTGPDALGAAYVYTSDALGNWTRSVKLMNPTGADSSQFGSSVDVYGDRLVVGAPNLGIGTGYRGRAHIYARDTGGGWNHAATLKCDRSETNRPYQMGPCFGYSVAIRGDSVLVGAFFDNGGFGAAFQFRPHRGTWIRRELVPTDYSHRQLGYSAKIAGGAMLAGTPVDNGFFDQGGVQALFVDNAIAGPVTVTATDETYKDKVQISWSDDQNNELGFKLYRDGALIASPEANIRTYFDFDAEPGRTHEYCVTAVLPGGFESRSTCDFGLRPPDGNITGRVSTQTGAGVAGAQVSLDPAPNRALLFDGSGGNMTVADGNVFGDAFTTEFWYRGHSAATGTLLRHSTTAYADAFTLLNPANLTVLVNGVSQPTGVDVNDGAWHHLAIDRTKAGGTFHLYKDGQLAYFGTIAPGVAVDTAGALTFGASLTGAIDDIRVWDHVRSASQIDSAKSFILTGTESGLTAYWPLDAFDGAGAEEPVADRYGRVATGAHWIGDAAPLIAFAIADLQGNFVLPKLRYGTSTTFKMTPGLTGHQFSPAFKTITLSTGNPVQNEVGFTDVTSFTVAGFVKYHGVDCVAANVPIFVDDQLRATTDGNGRYAVPVAPGAHVIEPRLAGHTFLPASISLASVAGDVAGQTFDETTVRKLTGLVAGGCNIPIGTLSIAIESENRCFSRTFDASAAYAEALPPLKYFVRVTNVVAASGGVDGAKVLKFFDDVGAREVDLTAGDQELNFRYRAPLRIEIEGLPAPAPNCAITVPVLAQTDRFPLTIRVVEDYGTATCPVDSGTVTVYDEIIDQEKNPVTLVVKDGQAFVATDKGLTKYVTAANTPNIFAGRVDAQGVDRSYQKSLSVVAEVEGQDPVTQTVWAIVTGHRPRAATFTALTEGIPLFILHDPPGDHSFSSLAEETSVCNKVSNASLVKNTTGFEAKVELGVDFLLGFLVMFRTKAHAFLSGGLEIGVEAKTTNEMEICAKTTQEFRTSADNLYIGRDGDLYVGTALNLLFAKTDVIKVENCEVVASQSIAMGVDSVQTTYSFTDAHIRGVVIPQLADLARLTPSDSLRFNSARRNWEKTLALNDSIKAAAQLEQNRSFSAGSEFSFSSTTEKTRSVGYSVNAFTNAEVAYGFNFDAAVSANEGKFYTKFEFGYEREASATSSSSRTTAYTLSDDDIGDFFSVDVKKDLLFGTPVFDIVGGTSSCPWEPWPDPKTGAPRTQPVDGPMLTIEPPVRNNVPPDGKAVFTLNLTNDSQADQLREYTLLNIQEDNPGGAILKLDGDPFSNGTSFFLQPGQTRQATLTVERGPSRYFYDDLKVMMVPPCEYELYRSGGPLNLSHAVTFSVAFEAPCSDITLLRPQPGWSVPAGTDSLQLLLTNFQLAISEEDSLEAVGAEYQLAGTDHWLPIGEEIPAASVPRNANGEPGSVAITWRVGNVPEGSYTVRAFAKCSAGKTYSTPSSGVIDRTAPVVFGTPQPADGVLSFGEDISITYNEDLDCASAAPVNVHLATTTGVPQAIDVLPTCNGRSLVLTPSGSLSPFEGQVLRASVTGIRDKVGNLAANSSWTFTVRRGDLAWAQSAVSQDLPYASSGRVAVNLVNGLGEQLKYTLGALPDWLTADAANGDSVPALSQTNVAFNIASTLDIGSYDATVVATANTVPPTATVRTATLQVHVNVLKVVPTWTVNPADYEHSMTVRAKVYVGADSLIAPQDVLAAFVGDQVRGVAHPQLVSDGWRYFLTVYGKPPAYERIRFKVWDSRTSKTYLATDKTLKFVADSTYGGYGHAIEIRTRVPSPANEQVIPIAAGWTWFSVNRRPSTQDDRTVAAVLSNLIPSPGDLVKAQDGSVQMFDANAGWVGTLDTLGVTASYRIKTAAAGEIRYESARVLPSLYPIPVKKGWNWIGYTPDDARAPGAALGNLVSSPGDVLRSQSQFAEFATGAWAGSLASMAPGQGFDLYRTSAASTSFPYDDIVVGPMIAAAHPAAGAEPTSATPVDANGLPFWECDYRAFQYDMVAAVEVSGMAPGTLRQLAAVVDGEIRGVAKPVYVPERDKTLFFVMIRSNQPRGETVRFQALDHASGKVYAVGGTMAFEADAVHGTTTQPVTLTADGTILADLSLPVAFELGNSRPNPMVGNNAAIVRYALPQATHVAIELFDINGRRVREIVNAQQAPGWYDVTVTPRDLHGGVYFYRMRAGSYSATRRLVVVR